MDINALKEKVVLDDIPERYLPIVEILGIPLFIKMCEFSVGDEIYFPKVETVLAPARNREIVKEYDQYNTIELAKKYNLTVPQVKKIVRDKA